MQALFAFSVLLLLFSIGLYHRFYLMGGNVDKLDAQLKQEECRRLSIRHPRSYIGMLYWSERIMQNLHRAATYEQLCACQALLANFKKYFRDMPEARAEWEAIEAVVAIKQETIRRQAKLVPVDVRYSVE